MISSNAKIQKCLKSEIFWLQTGSAKKNPYLAFEVCRLSAKYSGVLSLNSVYLSRLYRCTKDDNTDAEFFMGIFFASGMDTKGRFTGLVDHLFVVPLSSLGGICFSSASMMALKKMKTMSCILQIRETFMRRIGLPRQNGLLKKLPIPRFGNISCGYYEHGD